MDSNLKGAVFMSWMILLFLVACLGVYLVVESTPKEKLDSIEGTFYVPLIFGTYWISVLIVCVERSIGLTKKTEETYSNSQGLATSEDNPIQARIRDLEKGKQELEKDNPHYERILKENAKYSISDKIGFELAKALLVREKIYLKRAELYGTIFAQQEMIKIIDDKLNMLQANGGNVKGHKWNCCYNEVMDLKKRLKK